MDTILEQLQRVKYPVSRSMTLPPGCYTSEAWFQQEMDTLFSSSWIGIGRRDQWRDSGDYRALHIGKTPIVVTLDGDGQLHALSNTCLHRNSEIMSGDGNCRAMVCPFHGWSYDHTGKVLSSPRMESAAGFTSEGMCLKRFAVTERNGFVFLNLDEDAQPLDDWLGDFDDLHAPWSLSSLVTGRSRTLEVACNWKLFIEVFNEYYHLPYVHPDSINHYYPEPEPADDVMGEYTSQFGKTSANPALLDDNQQSAFPMIDTLGEFEQQGTRYTWVFPNTTFAAGVDCLWMYHVYPLSATRTLATQTICFPSGTASRDDFEKNARDYYHRFDMAIDEDIPALEKQQSGMSSPHAVQGRFSALEPSVGNFACWYAEQFRKCPVSAVA